MAYIAPKNKATGPRKKSRRVSRPPDVYNAEGPVQSDHLDLKPADGSLNPFGQVPGLLSKIAKGFSSEHMRLATFMKRAWTTVNPGTPLVWNWHLDLMAECLEALHLGQVKHVAFNVPPRFSKSFTVSVCFPTWEWTEDPTMRFMFSSYAQKLCNRHSLDRRAIINDGWYQENWGGFVKLAEDQNLKTEYQNTAKGVMVTMPIGGTATGSGGRRLIIDDPMDPKRAESKTIRESTLEFVQRTLSTRLDDSSSSKILVEQRLHKHDVTGTIVREEEGWLHVAIPIMAKSTRVYKFPMSGRVLTMKEGDLLCPERKNDEDIKELEGPTQLGDRAAKAQLYQEPSDQEGVTILRTYWRRLKQVPACTYSIWVWDTAIKDKQTSDWSVGMRIGLWGGRIYIYEVVRKRMQYPELKKTVRACYLREPTALILVEDKSSGQSIIQDLGTATQDEVALPIIGTEPDFNKLDKSQRLALVLGFWEANLVHTPEDAAWHAALEDEAAIFPDGDHDDQVDAMVHGVKHIKDMLEGDGSTEDDAQEADEDFEAV